MPTTLFINGELQFPAGDTDHQLAVMAFHRLPSEERRVAIADAKLKHAREAGMTEAEIAQFRHDLAEAEAAVKKQDIYHMSKSGKRMSIQIGSTWYEDHDVAVNTPLKVLTDLIPQGNEGHVRHRNARRLLRRLMKHPGFGVCAQIELIQKVGMYDGMRESTTFLLTKKQYLWVASALSDEYLALAIKAQYDNLSESERALDSKQFVAMLSDEAGTFWNDSAKAETPEQTTARLDTMDAIDAELAVWNALKDQLPTDLELAEMQLASFSAVTEKSDTINSEMPDIVEEAVASAARIRDMLTFFLNTKPATLDTAVDCMAEVYKRVNGVNIALIQLARLANTCSTYEWASHYHPYDTTPFVYKATNVVVSVPMHKNMLHNLDNKGILAKLPKHRDPRFLHDEVIEFGLYVTLYGWMGDSERESMVMSNFRQKYGLTPKQTLLIASMMENSLSLRKQDMSLVIVQKDGGQEGWVIHTVSRQ
jgi:hypothetical protein